MTSTSIVPVRPCEPTRTMTFSEAAPLWLNIHQRHIGTGTLRHYRNCIRVLMTVFGRVRLSDVRATDFEEYQKHRRAGTAGMRPAGPSLVNHELNTLSQILDRVGLWASVKDHYDPLKLPRPKAGRALSPEEERRLFRIASSNPRWKIAYCCALISANTTAGPNEIRHLRLRNIDLNTLPPAIHIEEGVKNEYRQRTIPLNQVAAWAVQQLVKRAHELGATRPEDYFLPHRARNGAKGFDPNRPISSWRGSWDKLRIKAELPTLRIYDLRHHAITKLLENESISERTVIELAGHVNRQMLERYSHIRMRAKQEAVNVLERQPIVPPQPEVDLSSVAVPQICRHTVRHLRRA